MSKILAITAGLLPRLTMGGEPEDVTFDSSWRWGHFGQRTLVANLNLKILHYRELGTTKGDVRQCN